MNKITARSIAIFSSDVMMKTKSMSMYVLRTAACLDRDSLLDCFFVGAVRWRQLLHLQNRHAQVADFIQCKSSELRDCFADVPKHVVNRMKRIAAAGGLE